MLKFGSTVRDYVAINPDMTPFRVFLQCPTIRGTGFRTQLYQVGFFMKQQLVEYVSTDSSALLWQSSQESPQVLGITTA